MARKYKVGDEIQGQSNHYEICQVIKVPLPLRMLLSKAKVQVALFLNSTNHHHRKVEWYKEWIAYQDQAPEYTFEKRKSKRLCDCVD